MKKMKLKFVYTLALALLMWSWVGSSVFAQQNIAMGSSDDEITFQGTGSQVIYALWQTCSSTGCTMSGSAGGGNQFGYGGTYQFAAPNAMPFTLVAGSGGNFTINQTSTITFSYTSGSGTLMGTVKFTSASQSSNPEIAYLYGTLTVTGGTFASSFPSGGSFTLEFADGSGLSALVNTAESINGEIYYGSTLSPASSPTSPPPCSGGSTIGSNFNGTAIPGGDYIWFNANFSADGIQNGTVLQFQGGTIQFSANGTNYNLSVPNATVTFSSSVNCASTSFDTSTNTWMTTVPVSGSDEIFLSGLSFPVPASGLSGGVNPVDWNESFSSNTPNVSLQWRWGAAVFSSFSTDYNSLGVKPTHQNACLYNNGDHAGSPENFPHAVGGARGGGAANVTGSWSGTLSATPNCGGGSI